MYTIYHWYTAIVTSMNITSHYIVTSSWKDMIHDMIKLNTLNYILLSNIVIYIRYFRYIQYQS